jgi:hypothetical protein
MPGPADFDVTHLRVRRGAIILNTAPARTCNSVRPPDPWRPPRMQDFASHFTYPHMTVVGDDLLVVMRATAPVANITATSKWWGIRSCHDLLCPIDCWWSGAAWRWVSTSPPSAIGGEPRRCITAASTLAISAQAHLHCGEALHKGRLCRRGCESIGLRLLHTAAGTTTTTAMRCRSTACGASGGTPMCSGRRTRGSTRCGRG